ncbi:hypothetical protein BDQ12DRAFT_686655 [Crucibulum laeve]|uniref:Uncharacterized protein n=1 Tax=Crucibulum laeve TaxID=68775 RepID=A0A5C3LXE3_9AGAR|nr:hypothetical protein BDQ12DRAFT_686655 [Crucibulum laeve]
MPRAFLGLNERRTRLFVILASHYNVSEHSRYMILFCIVPVVAVHDVVICLTHLRDARFCGPEDGNGFLRERR